MNGKVFIKSLAVRIIVLLAAFLLTLFLIKKNYDNELKEVIGQRIEKCHGVLTKQDDKSSAMDNRTLFLVHMYGSDFYTYGESGFFDPDPTGIIEKLYISLYGDKKHPV